MGVREALKNVGKILLGWIPILIGAAIVVVMRRSPADPSKQPTPQAPDMKKAEDNVEKLEQAQQELEQQHQKIEEVLTPQQPAKPSDSLQDAVDKWNEG